MITPGAKQLMPPVLVTVDSKKLLPILPVVINNRVVNIALDRCSTASYIVDSVAKHLGAIQVGYSTIPINVVGGSRVFKGPIFQFRINLVDATKYILSCALHSRQ